jgi:hypothetical protein
MFRNEVHGKVFGTASLPVGAGVRDVARQALQGQTSYLHELLSARWAPVQVRLAAEADVVAVLTNRYWRLHVFQAYWTF